jgi:hypothetical protein
MTCCRKKGGRARDEGHYKLARTFDKYNAPWLSIFPLYSTALEKEKEKQRKRKEAVARAGAGGLPRELTARRMCLEA